MRNDSGPALGGVIVGLSVPLAYATSLAMFFIGIACLMAGSMTLAYAAASKRVADRNRTLAFAMVQSCIQFGLALGPLLGAAVAQAVAELHEVTEIRSILLPTRGKECFPQAIMAIIGIGGAVASAIGECRLLTIAGVGNGHVIRLVSGSDGLLNLDELAGGIIDIAGDAVRPEAALCA